MGAGRPPVVPAVHSLLIDKAVKVTPDSQLITLRRSDILSFEHETRAYYQALHKGKERDFSYLNSFLFLFYADAAPKGVKPRHFLLLLAAYMHCKRDYLLTDGLRRLDAKTSMKHDLFTSALLRQYFPHLSKPNFTQSYNRFIFEAMKQGWIKREPEYYPLHPIERKFIKRCYYYSLQPTGLALIDGFQAHVMGNYDKVLNGLRAKTHLLHTFNELPADLRKMTFKKREVYKKRLQKRAEKL